VRARIDPALCTGHGRCYTLTPEVFEDDGDGFGHVKYGGELPKGLEGAAQIGKDNCPEQAISLE
jgi:ferredoxin